MYKPHVDVLSFGEIGGVGEMTYRTVRFPRYELRYKTIRRYSVRDTKKTSS